MRERPAAHRAPAVFVWGSGRRADLGSASARTVRGANGWRNVPARERGAPAGSPVAGAEGPDMKTAAGSHPPPEVWPGGSRAVPDDDPY
ncbi:hypothetical protein CEE82_11795, partial [Lactobacillus crispatus]